MIIDFAEYPQCVCGNILTGGGCSLYTREIVPGVLLQSSAGVRVKFATNSKQVDAVYNTTVKSVVPHIGRPLLNCISYAVLDGKAKRPVKMECISQPGKYENVYRKNTDNKLFYEFYLPSFNKIDNLTISLDDDADFFPAEKPTKAPIVFLGGPFTLGSGCTFATAMFSSVISRKLGREHYNFAINSHRCLSVEIASAISALKPAAVVAEIQSVGMNFDYMLANLEQYLSVILQDTDCPAVLLTQPFWGDKSGEYEQKLAYLRETVRKLSRDYPCRLVLVDGAKVFEGIDYDRYSFSLNFVNVIVFEMVWNI